MFIVYIYVVPLVICILCSWYLQIIEDTSEFADTVGQHGFIPFWNIMMVAFILLCLLIMIAEFIINLPTIIKEAYWKYQNNKHEIK